MLRLVQHDKGANGMMNFFVIPSVVEGSHQRIEGQKSKEMLRLAQHDKGMLWLNLSQTLNLNLYLLSFIPANAGQALCPLSLSPLSLVGSQA